jgi:lipid-A-disaccharide synthase
MRDNRGSRREDLVIFSNGPGEVSTWVLPVIEAVRGREHLSERYRIVLVIHPCQFGSGKEQVVAGSFEGVDAVIGPSEYMKMLLTGVGVKKHSFARDGVLFSLGGNLMHPVLFRRRIKGRHRLFAYTNNPGWHERYERVFVRNDWVRNKFLASGCEAGKVLVTGDLVYSSLKTLRGRSEARKGLGIGSKERMIVFMPGSREFEVKYMLPVFLKVIQDLSGETAGLRIFLLKSPYVNDELLRSSLAMGGRIGEAESLPGELVQLEGKIFRIAVRLPGGMLVPVLERGLEEWGEGVDFAVTLPGTNTVQLAYRGIPALVVTALNKPELIPVEGLAGIVKLIPFFGRRVTAKAVLSYLKGYRFSALPNIYENEELLPELFGVIETRDITKKLAETLASGEPAVIKKRLARFRFHHNPVDVIVREVWG